ncbi:MAG: hypothetical protein R3D01_11960 [Hyphomicrobiales bacterium]
MSVPDLTSTITGLASTITAGNSLTVNYRISSANASTWGGEHRLFLSTDSTIDAAHDGLLVYANAFNRSQSAAFSI